MYEYRRAATGKAWVTISGTRIFAKDGDAGFSIIYGTFWVGIGITLFFIVERADILATSPIEIAIQSGVFFLTHWWSYHSNKKTDERRGPDILVNFGVPLLRMFLPVCFLVYLVDFGARFIPAVVVVWMLIKTTVDVGCHITEHDKKRIKFS